MFSCVLPEDFIIPNIYNEMKPEEFAIVLLSGKHIIEKVRSDNHMERIEELKSLLERSHQELTNTNTVKQEELNQANINHQRELEELRQQNRSSVEERLSALVTGLFETVGDRAKAAALDVLNKDKEHRELLDKRTQESCSELERRAADIGCFLDRTSELVSRVERVESNAHSKSCGRYGSSVKGAKNEERSHQLIIQSFGNYNDFNLQEKKTFSGDHIFTWNGLRIMWEDKDYSVIVNRAEVDKALRDFEINKDCHVLIFVSAHSGIAGHETGNTIDIEIFDGRLVMYVSNFADTLDPVGFIRSVIQTIIVGMKPSLIRNSFGTGTSRDTDAIKIVIASLNPLICSMISQEKGFDALVSDMKIRVQAMKNMLIQTRKGIEQVIVTILAEMTNRENEDTGEETNTTNANDDTEDTGVAKSLTSKPASSGATRASPKCSNCGMMGHRITNCPVKKK